MSLADRIKALCDRKLKKLTPWRWRNGGQKKTLLLLESDDVQMMNHLKLAKVLRDAYPTKPEGIDYIWYANTALQPQLEFLDLSEMWSRPLGLPTSWPSEPSSVF
jgi:hypothetical protein